MSSSVSRFPLSTKSGIGVLEDRGSSWQEFGCLGNLSLYNEQLLLSTPLLKALSSLSRCPLSTKSSWRTGYASWRIQTLMEGSYTYFLQVHQVSTFQVQVLGLELSNRSCHQLFHRPLRFQVRFPVIFPVRFPVSVSVPSTVPVRFIFIFTVTSCLQHTSTCQSRPASEA